MKRKLLVFVVLLLTVIQFGCDPEEEINDPDAPVINLLRNVITTAPDDVFWVEALITDDVGIKNINLLKQDWYLDKNIYLGDSARKEYHLRYKFTTPADAVDEGHVLELSVEDLGENIISVEIPIQLNKDMVSPVFNITSPEEGGSIQGGDLLNLFIEVTDNIGVDTFLIDAPDFGIDTLISFDPVNPRYIFVNSYLVPEEMTDGTYYINLSATDSTSNKTDHAISLIVGEVAASEVYCVGGATWSGWDTPINPMLMRNDEENEGWYELVTYSFGIQDYNGVKFVGQRDWGPLNWGLESVGSEVMINDQSSEKIVLEEEGYHKVRFSPDEMAYEAEFVGTETPVLSEMYILGSGIVGMENAFLDPSGALPMVQDSENPYIYTATVEFTEKGVVPEGEEYGWGAVFIFISNPNDVSEFNLGFTYFPEDNLDPEWIGWYGYVVGDLSLNLDPIIEEEIANIADFPPEDGYWNSVPYIAYYGQPGTYEIKLDYHIHHASITKVSD